MEKVVSKFGKERKNEQEMTRRHKKEKKKRENNICLDKKNKRSKLFLTLEENGDLKK